MLYSFNFRSGLTNIIDEFDCAFYFPAGFMKFMNHLQISRPLLNTLRRIT